MRPLRSIMAAILAFTSSGCATSHLGVVPYDPSTPRAGVPHHVKMTQFEIAVTWKVTGCTTGVNGHAATLDILKTVEAKDKAAVDPDQYYLLDATPLQGLFQNASFTVERHPDGSLKSINTSVDDQTGPAIVNVLTAAARLAAVGITVAGEGEADCPADITRMLSDRAAQDVTTKAAKKAVEDQTLVLTRILLQATEAGASTDAITRRRLGNAQRRLELLKDILQREQAALKTLADKLSDTQTVTWPLEGTTFVSDASIAQPSEDALKRWHVESDSPDVQIFASLVDPRTGIAPDPSPPPPASSTTATDERQDTTPVDTGNGGARTGPVDQDAENPPIQPERLNGAGAPATTPVAAQRAPQQPSTVVTAPPPNNVQTRSRVETPARPAANYVVPDPIPGLPFREPRLMRLLVCAGPCPTAADALRPAAATLKSYDVLLLQADPLLYLTFMSRRFASITNAAGFSESGVLVSYATSQARGAGSGVAATVADASTQIAAYVTNERGSETARLTAQTEEAKAEKALADARAALVPATTDPEAVRRNQAIATYQAEATLASSERALIEAQVALALARAQLTQ